MAPTLSWQFGAGLHAQIKCSWLFSFWRAQVQQKQASQLEMDFNLTRVLEVNDLQGKDYMYLI